jgi:kynurenine formamidase
MLIDLSVPLDENTPAYPGDPKLKLEKLDSLEKNGYEDHSLFMPLHMGTHIDAPAHMIEGGKKLSEFPIDYFSGRGVCLDASGGFNLAEIKKVKINEGDIVFFHTGMSAAYYKPDYFEKYPEVPAEIIKFLVEKKVKIVGVDMCSPDYSPFPIHKILLGNNILIIENLTNLGVLLGKDFKIYAFPLKFALDGSPVRVVAEIN